MTLQAFIDQHVDAMRPLEIQARLAGWDAAVTGEDRFYEQQRDLNLKMRGILSDAAKFGQLQAWKAAPPPDSPLLERQLDVLYRAFLGNQLDPDLITAITSLESRIQQNFSVFRGEMDGRKVTDSEIKAILKTSRDGDQRRRAWEASKQVGAVVQEDLIRLVHLRNDGARSLGFSDYHTLALTLAEQRVDDLDELFEDLRQQTDGPFRVLKAEMDAALADHCDISPDALQPWHYHDPFFQEPPQTREVDLDGWYANRDIADLAARFFAGVGLPVDTVLARSDLYEKDGKNPHAFCTDIDREGDVRILCNIRSNASWMDTTLHELGHAVYNLYQDPEVPYLLRRPAHIFTTEAIAMLFGRLSHDPDWMGAMLGLGDDQRAEAAAVTVRFARMRQLVFARWAMVMYAFEKALYADPEGDLNGLWWALVERYQGIRPPEGRDRPDWAAKIHFSIAPCYYHNYMLGELLASQLRRHMVSGQIHSAGGNGTSFVGRREVGEYLRENVFRPGAAYPWNEMIRRATGEPLTPRHFLEQFVL